MRSISKFFFRITYSICWLLTIFITYSILCYNVLPKVQQSVILSLVRSKEGYSSRILHSELFFPFCELAKLNISIEEPKNEVKIKACIDPFNAWDSYINFQNETYKITIVLNVPITEHSLSIGTVPVKAGFINKNHQVQEIDAQGLFRFKLKGIMRKIYTSLKKFFGIDIFDIEFEAIIDEEFINEFFQIGVMYIEIQDPLLVINYVELHVNAILTGYKSYLYDWFWISAIINTLILRWLISYGLRKIYKFTIRIMNRLLIIFRVLSERLKVLRKLVLRKLHFRKKTH